MAGRRSHHANLPYAKRDLEVDKIRSPNDAGKGYLKTWGLETPAAWVNVLTHVNGLLPTTIKLNPRKNRGQ